jgi:hypothetical protein
VQVVVHWWWVLTLYGAQVCLMQIYFDVFHDFIYLMRFLHLQMGIALHLCHKFYNTIISTLLFLNGRLGFRV